MEKWWPLVQLQLTIETLAKPSLNAFVCYLIPAQQSQSFLSILFANVALGKTTKQNSTPEVVLALPMEVAQLNSPFQNSKTEREQNTNQWLIPLPIALQPGAT